jgi:hypothetical protein
LLDDLRAASIYLVTLKSNRTTLEMSKDVRVIYAHQDIYTAATHDRPDDLQVGIEHLKNRLMDADSADKDEFTPLFYILEFSPAPSTLTTTLTGKEFQRQ